jgi:ABC-type cobalamin transport system permease subunit
MNVCTVASGAAAAVSVRIVARLKLTASSFPVCRVRHTLKMYHHLA